MTRSIYIVGILAALLCVGCSSSAPINTSGGSSYEVLVTGPCGEANQLVTEALRDIMLTALPQEEPAFDVSTLVKTQLDQSTRYARNIILVSTDSTHLPKTRVRYEQNVYARPQTIVHIDAPSVAQLKSDLPQCIQSVADELTRAEIGNAITNLRAHHSREAEALIDSIFGCRLWVPEDLRLARRAPDFLWFSNQAAQALQNICVYRYAADSLERQQLLSKRDSILGRNVPGATPGNRMRTVVRSVEFRVRSESQVQALGARGLWEMEGDAMGGPFVCVALQQGDSVLCAEAFVYAPEMRKRNMVRRLEAALYTLKMKQ